MKKWLLHVNQERVPSESESINSRVHLSKSNKRFSDLGGVSLSSEWSFALSSLCPQPLVSVKRPSKYKDGKTDD